MNNKHKLSFYLKELSLPQDTLPESILNTYPVNFTADSRKITSGSVFIAKKGLTIDGHNFLEDVQNKGALCAFVKTPNKNIKLPQIQVSSPEDILPGLLSLFYNKPETKMKLIGLTGTNGKTTTSYILDGIFSGAGFKTGIIGTISYRYADITEPAPFTSPDPELLYPLLQRMVEHGVEVLVMEVSSHALKQKRIGNILFDAALLTNFTQDHLDFHKTMEDYAASKRLLFSKHLKPGSTVAVWNETDKKNDIIPSNLNPLTYSMLENTKTDYKCTDYNLSLNGISGKITTGGKNYDFSIKLIGEHNILNLMGALAVASGFGISTEQALENVSNVIVPGRLEPVPGKSHIFVDYAHTPDALDRAQEALNKLKKGRLITVFGCGGDRDAQKRPLMGKSVDTHSEIAVVTSDNPRTEDPVKIIEEILPGMSGGRISPGDISKARKGTVVITDRKDAIYAAVKGARRDDVILIAGKGHEDYQIIGTEKIHFDDREVAAAASRITMNISTSETAKFIGGNLNGTSEIITGFVTDSRKIRKGSLFFALKGTRTDGHKFVNKALKDGASAAVVEYIPENGITGNFITVNNVEKALGKAAKLVRSKLSGTRFIGITGSCGKTSVKEITAAILSHFGKTTFTSGNLNNHLGVPLTLGSFDGDEDFGVIEMGMNAPGEISYLSRITEPHIAVITSVCPVHLEGTGSIEGVRKAKSEITDGLLPGGTLIAPHSEPYIIKTARNKGFKVITFGESPDADYSVSNITPYLEKSVFTLSTAHYIQQFEISLPGKHQCLNAAAALAVADTLGLTEVSKYSEALTEIILPGNRSKIINLRNNIKIMNDSYNASPESFKAVFNLISSVRTGDTFLILGDMLELGESSAEYHFRLGQDAARTKHVFCTYTGEMFEHFRQGYESVTNISPAYASTPGEAAGLTAKHLKNTKNNSFVLIKASRGIHLEKSEELLKQIFTP